MNKNKEDLERRIEEIRSNMIRLRDATEADLKAGEDKEKAELFFKRRNKYKSSIEEYIKAYKKGYSLNKTEQEYVLRYSGLTIEQHVLPAADFWKI